MIAVNVPSMRFDIVEYIRKLRNAGASQALAEVQAQELEHAMSGVLEQARLETKQAFDNKELVTKGDLELTKLALQKDIEILRKELEVKIAENTTKIIIWVSGIMGTFGVFFFGVLARGFHWI